MGISAIVSVLAALLFPSAAPAPAPAAFVPSPPGSHPQLSFIKFSIAPGSVQEVIGVEPESGERQHLAGSDFSLPGALLPISQSRLSWSADGSRILVTAIVGTHLERPYVIDVDSGKRHAVRHTGPFDRIVGNAVLSPDGDSLVFCRQVPSKSDDTFSFARAALFSVGVKSGKLRRLTPWEEGELLYPTTFTSDGRAVAFTRYGNGDPAAAELDLGSGKITVWATNAEQPAVAPNGEMVAVRNTYGSGPDPVPKVRASELLVLRSPGQETSILRRKGGVSSPSWDPPALASPMRP